MSTTIPSAQLQAITRLELASEALDKALRAVEHPELEFGGGAIIAPSGLKHLAQLRGTLHNIERAIRPSDSTAYEAAPVATVTPAIAPAAKEVALSELGSRVLDSAALGLAADLRAALARARAQLRLLQELHIDPKRLDAALMSALRTGSRLGRRVYDAIDGDDEPVR